MNDFFYMNVELFECEWITLIDQLAWHSFKIVYLDTPLQ